MPTKGKWYDQVRKFSLANDRGYKTPTTKSHEGNDEQTSASLGNRTEICQDCQKIDFSRAFAEPMPSFQVIQELGRFTQSTFVSRLDHYSPSCMICREFQWATAKWNYRPGQWPDVLRALPLPVTPVNETSGSGVSVWLQPIPSDANAWTNDSFAIDLTSAVQHTVDRGWIVCYPTASGQDMLQRALDAGWTAPCPTTAGQGLDLFQPISKRFNASLVKTWLSACLRSHGQLCNTSVLMPGLLLIDCDTLEIRQGVYQPRYLALSYVWAKGPPEVARDNPSSTILSSRHLPPRDSLSQVVKDSIFVTNQLGFRYLWIDKYCINQSDPRVKIEQIENMDKVYMGAELTLVAAVGADERHGLPGVGVEKEVRTVEMGDLNITYIPRSFDSAFKHSEWGTRGWTFQEELLSRRLLYFFEQEMVFVCRERESREALGARYSQATFQPRLKLFHEIQDDTASQGMMQEQRYYISSMWRIIEDYTSRNLTYDSDALRAFAGITKVFEEKVPSIYHIQGLPVEHIYDVGEQSRKKLIESLCWEARAVSSRTRAVSRRTRRRKEFPSWTWAAWTGPISISDNLGSSLIGTFGRSAVFEYANGSQISLEELANSLRSNSNASKRSHGYMGSHPGSEITGTDLNSPTVLILEAAFVPVTCFTLDASPSSDFPVLHRCFCAGLTIKDIPTPESPGFTPNSLLDGLSNGTLACVLLGIADLWGLPEAHLLLIQWDGPEKKEAHRVGKSTAFTPRDNRVTLEQLREKLWGNLQWGKVRLV